MSIPSLLSICRGNPRKSRTIEKITAQKLPFAALTHKKLPKLWLLRRKQFSSLFPSSTKIRFMLVVDTKKSYKLYLNVPSRIQQSLACRCIDISQCCKQLSVSVTVTQHWEMQTTLKIETVDTTEKTKASQIVLEDFHFRYADTTVLQLSVQNIRKESLETSRIKGAEKVSETVEVHLSFHLTRLTLFAGQ